MYSPFLRGKQFEFLALKELAKELPDSAKQNLFPIIEPVKRGVRDAKNAFQELLAQNLRFAVVLNPISGDFQRGDRNYYELVKDVLPTPSDVWMPAFQLIKGEETLINSVLDANHFDKFSLILPKDQLVDDWVNLLSDPRVQYIVVCNADSTSTRRKLNKTGKQLIRLDDNFTAEKKNADYIGKEDGFFTDQHFYYKLDSWTGFGDYTTLPSSFVEGGLTPYVVAIHFTYKLNTEEIRVHHFLSDSNPKGPENVQGKFAEAARKVMPFFSDKPEGNSRYIKRIQEFVDKQHYPGLGLLKKLSIEHHISLMARY